jgi:hypothetical protein
VSEREILLALLRAAAAALEASRERIDDLNVYPVPDGDTGTNMALSLQAILQAAEESRAADRPTLARELTRAALMGARGSSGVILSQIVRGAAEALATAPRIDARALAGALRAACDAAYRGVRRPVEGTMLTVIREMAEEAEARAPAELAPADLLKGVLARGEDALRRTPQVLEALREAGVVDAGGAGLVELVRGLAAAAAGEPLPPPPPREELGLEAAHREPSRYRYCTTFVVEGAGLDPQGLERELERLGDSLLVVADGSAVKVHLHTDDPGAALQAGTARGVIDAVEIANMHVQAEERKRRLLRAAPAPPAGRTGVVAVVVGAGNRRLYASLGATAIVEGGPSMNPSTEEILAALEGLDEPEAIVLPNNANAVMAAEQAAALAAKPVRVVPSRSLPAGLAALVAFDPCRSAEENEAAMRQAAAAVATGAVATASREVERDGLRVGEGEYLGLLEGEPIAGGPDFEEVAAAVVERLLREPREVLTLLAGEGAPPLERLRALVEERYPRVELDVQVGGQPHYLLLIAAE